MNTLIIRLDNLYLLHLALERLVRQFCDDFADYERCAVLIRAVIVKKMPEQAGRDADDIMLKTIAESIPAERNCLAFTWEEEGITMKTSIVEGYTREEAIMLPATPDFAEEGDADHEELITQKLNEFILQGTK